MNFSPSLLAFSVVLNFALNATGTVRYVNIGNTVPAAPYTSWNTASTNVQTALNACVSGDQVWVAQGVYFQNILLSNGISLYGGFQGNETSLDQRDCSHLISILDGKKLNSVVTLAAKADRTTRIDGFTIRNGNATTGGGIYAYDASPSIANNIIISNQASTGAGIACSKSTLLIESNLIQNNFATTRGGGISSSSSSALIRKNRIIGNTDGMLGGSGINMSLDRGTVVSDNLIFANINQSSLFFVGVGLFVVSTADCSIRNNTIVWNDTYGYTQSEGAEVQSLQNTNLTIANNIIAFATYGIYSSKDNQPVYLNNCVFGNSLNYSNIPDQTGSNGNISVDPGFVDNSIHPDFHLSAASACRDAGENSLVPTGASDLEGGTRILGGTVDIGALEFGNSIIPTVQQIVRVSPSGDDSHDGSSWALAKKTVQAAIDAEVLTGGEVWVSGGTYVENLKLRIGVHLYGGFFGNEVDRDQRNWTANPTILDGSRGNNVVTLEWLFRWNSIDGFTIQNGSQNGGGVYARHSAPRIANNTITRNNSGLGYGGGVYCSWPAPPVGNPGINFILTNNIFSLNKAVKGGGAYFNSSTAVQMIAMNNRFESNTANIAPNTSTSDAPSGGALYFYNGPVIIANNLFLYNTATNGSGYNACRGGGIFGQYSKGQIINNTLVGNIALDDSGGFPDLGGGMYIYSPATVANNLILFGSTGVGEASLDEFRNNCVFGNWLDYLILDPTGVNGNISDDPMIDSGFRLGADSPCINAGENNLVSSLIDFDNNPRISGGTVDIGAYEFQNPASRISYAWLQQYGLPTDGSADNADTDGDRLNSWQEWRAGTSPIDSASVLKMLTITNGISGATVRWQSVSGINYLLQHSDLISGAGFSTIQTNIPGQAGSTSFTDTNAVGARRMVYRVGVQ
jgi:hypothetical protein